MVGTLLSSPFFNDCENPKNFQLKMEIYDLIKPIVGEIMKEAIENLRKQNFQNSEREKENFQTETFETLKKEILEKLKTENSIENGKNNTKILNIQNLNITFNNSNNTTNNNIYNTTNNTYEQKNLNPNIDPKILNLLNKKYGKIYIRKPKSIKTEEKEEKNDESEKPKYDARLMEEDEYEEISEEDIINIKRQFDMVIYGKDYLPPFKQIVNNIYYLPKQKPPNRYVKGKKEIFNIDKGIYELDFESTEEGKKWIEEKIDTMWGNEEVKKEETKKEETKKEDKNKVKENPKIKIVIRNQPKLFTFEINSVAKVNGYKVYNKNGVRITGLDMIKIELYTSYLLSKKIKLKSKSELKFKPEIKEFIDSNQIVTKDNISNLFVHIKYNSSRKTCLNERLLEKKELNIYWDHKKKIAKEIKELTEEERLKKSSEKYLTLSEKANIFFDEYTFVLEEESKKEIEKEERLQRYREIEIRRTEEEAKLRSKFKITIKEEKKDYTYNNTSIINVNNSNLEKINYLNLESKEKEERGVNENFYKRFDGDYNNTLNYDLACIFGDERSDFIMYLDFYNLSFANNFSALTNDIIFQDIKMDNII
jgi:hypothetical protein